jgi:hypothetical protein
MAAMFGADPTLELLDEFANFDAGTELVGSHNMVPIPRRYMRHFIAGRLTPRKAWEIVGLNIVSHNNQAACAPLLDFLRLACTRNAAGDTASPLARPELTVLLADALLVVQHQRELITHKLPRLNHTLVLADGQQVAQSLGELVARQDVLDCHNDSALKTIVKSTSGQAPIPSFGPKLSCLANRLPNYGRLWQEKGA